MIARVDYILEITHATDRQDVDDRIDGILFLTASLGETDADAENRTIRQVYFASPAERAAARAMMGELSAEVELRDVDRERIDWLERYEQSLAAIPIGSRFVVAPHAALIGGHDRIAIVIPQEQAFGTGSHETTALCLAALESIDIVNAACADVGTGSGILAIGMSMLGASSVIAFDNDPEAMPVLLMNLERNGLRRGAVRCYCGSLDALRHVKFDVVTMNILPDVIGMLLPDMVSHLRSASRMILSGIILSRRDEVLAGAERHGLSLVSEGAAGEWWCGVVTPRQF